MIIWPNGPFGVGKTTVGRILVRRLGDALLYDPEPFGAALRAVVAPIDVAEDFQQLRAWPALVVRAAAVIRETYGGTLVMPMTVLDHVRCDTLTAGLHAIDSDLDLSARRDRGDAAYADPGRPEIDGPHTWCLQHLERGLKLCMDESFGEANATDDRSPEHIASAILKRVANGGYRTGHRQRLGSDELL